MDDMAVEGGSIWSRLTSSRGYTATSHFFVMDWASIWTDILLGVVIAGCLAAWVPADFWRSLFFADQPTLAKLTGPILGPLVGIASFVCSVGNVPLAAVLWNGGISFGGVVAFIFADLIVLPVLNIYRKYYGWRMALFLLVTFYVTMVLAGYAVELRVRRAGADPEHPGRGHGERVDPLGRHHVPRPRLPAAGRPARREVPPHRRPGDAPAHAVLGRRA